MYGEGAQVRTFYYVNDVIDGFIGFMKIPGFIGPPSLGDPSERTARALAKVGLWRTDDGSRVAPAIEAFRRSVGHADASGPSRLDKQARARRASRSVAASSGGRTP